MFLSVAGSLFCDQQKWSDVVVMFLFSIAFPLTLNPPPLSAGILPRVHRVHRCVVCEANHLCTETQSNNWRKCLDLENLPNPPNMSFFQPHSSIVFF